METMTDTIERPVVVRDERILAAAAIIDAALPELGTRSIITCTEVQNLLLDARNKLYVVGGKTDDEPVAGEIQHTV